MAGAARAQDASLTILHTNDTHGHLLPFSYPRVVAAGSVIEALDERRDIGGIARRATLVKRIREELKAKGTPVWLIDAGDFSDGTPFSTEYRGEADIAAMNATGYDFATLGNHEFNYPLEQTKKLIGLASYPVLCANVTEAGGKSLATPYVIRDAGPLKVGLFGLLPRSTSEYPAAREGLTIADEIQSARTVADLLRPQVDLLILISHAGEGVDERIAKEIPTIDVIVGGHSHTRLPSGQVVWRREDLQATNVNRTIIVQAHQWGGELGRLDLWLRRGANGRWQVERDYRARLLLITAEIPPDPAVSAVVERYWKPIAARYAEVVGTASGDFSSRGDDQAEYNLVTDAVREAFGTDIALENRGSVRAPIVEGPITMADLIALDPFDNTVVTFTISGRELKTFLVTHTPAVSGIRYRVANGQLAEATVDGRPIEDERMYTGATNSFFARGAFKGIAVNDTGKRRLETVRGYIRKKGTVSPAYDGRRVIIGGRTE
jgi:5'-nucleotidase